VSQQLNNIEMHVRLEEGLKIHLNTVIQTVVIVARQT